MCYCMVCIITYKYFSSFLQSTVRTIIVVLNMEQEPWKKWHNGANCQKRRKDSLKLLLAPECYKRAYHYLQQATDYIHKSLEGLKAFVKLLEQTKTCLCQMKVGMKQPVGNQRIGAKTPGVLTGIESCTGSGLLQLDLSLLTHVYKPSSYIDHKILQREKICGLDMKTPISTKICTDILADVLPNSTPPFILSRPAAQSGKIEIKELYNRDIVGQEVLRKLGEGVSTDRDRG